MWRSAPRHAPTADDAPLRAVIDIGSNSLRLVIFAGPARIPYVLLNEKVAANLGRTLSEDGRLPAKGIDLALSGLARFAVLVDLLGVANLRVVATAAVRDASNGPEFLDQVRALGLAPELLSGEQEAAGSAMGVLSAFPDANGIVGDLGGGSLELVEVAEHGHGRGGSFPFGTLRLPRLRERGPAEFDRKIRKAFAEAGWIGAAEGRSFYLVGGSWRALTQLAMHQAGYPLFDPHGYAMAPEAVVELVRGLAITPPKKLREIPRLPGSRINSLPDAAALLAAVVRHLRPRRLVASSFGLREGLLYGPLDEGQRRTDPLVAGARSFSARLGCLPGYGEQLDRWVAPLFEHELPSDHRLRLVASLLGGVARLPERSLRAQRSMEVALHERWVGIDGAGRAMVAAALLAHVGEQTLPVQLDRLCGAIGLGRAMRWGLATRFAHLLAGTAPEVLQRSAVGIRGDRLVLELGEPLAPLYAEGARQHHRALAQQLGAKAELVLVSPAAGKRWLARGNDMAVQ